MDYVKTLQKQVFAQERALIVRFAWMDNKINEMQNDHCDIEEIERLQAKLYHEELLLHYKIKKMSIEQMFAKLGGCSK